MVPGSDFSKFIDWGSHRGASHQDTWAGCKIVLYIYLRKVLPTVTSQNHQTLFVKWFCFSIPYEFSFILEILSELLTGCHATPLVTRCCFLITNITHGNPFHVNGHQMICHKCYRFERALFTFRHFLPYTPSCCSRFCWAQQFSPKISRSSCFSFTVSVQVFVWISPQSTNLNFSNKLYLYITF